MSLRQSFPKPQLPRTHFYLTVTRGGTHVRDYAVRSTTFYVLATLAPLALVWTLAASVYVGFHDELLARLMSRQVDAQYAYEDRLANLRAELDRVTSRQLVDQDNLGNRVKDLSARQVLLEGRASMIVSLAELANAPAREALARRDATPTRTAPSALSAPSAALPRPASAGTPAIGFAPVESRAEFPPVTSVKPRPEIFEAPARSGTIPSILPQHSSELEMSPARRLENIGQSLASVEFQQVRDLALLQAPVQARATRLKAALAAAGLDADKLIASSKADATGGPFIPVKVDPSRSPFDREFANLQDSLIAVEKINRILPGIPLRRPLPGNPDITSTFGVRVDPFLGRAAMHGGIDFREEYGAPVHATASGRVASAGISGGYGNMVEIDHGNGLSTRYGHMSAILVEEGQWVAQGAVIGKLGSTGRSTGPHLHYETRVDDEVVDPQRFLLAGNRLLARD